ncbi:MAG: alpha/beta fold hydrolase [Nitrospirae bacterium]|nr:alpha/beta fold hydrolase [Nitrospirota bacterium]
MTRLVAALAILTAVSQPPARPDLSKAVTQLVQEHTGRPLDVKTLLIKESKDVRQFEISFVGAAETRIFGGLYRPVGIEGVPMVLLVHDLGETRLEDLARDLARSGLASLALDLRGHGPSAGEPALATARWLTDSIEDTPQQAALLSAVDVTRALQVLKQETPQVFAVGVGLGANLAWIAAHFERVKGVALAGPLFCPQALHPLIEGKTSASKSLQPLATLESNLVLWFASFFELPRYQPRAPALVGEAITDPITPPACLKSWIAKVPRSTPIELVSFAHRGQFVSGEWTRSVIGWIERVLAGGHTLKRQKV